MHANAGTTGALIGVLAGALLAACGGDDPSLAAPDPDLPSPSPPTVAATWRTCETSDPLTSVARTYPRADVPELAGGPSDLHCGNAKYGLRHIAIRHTRDWEDLDADQPWAGTADAAMAAALAAPDDVRCDEERNSCAFTAEVAIDGADVLALVVVARQDGKIITAYPDD